MRVFFGHDTRLDLPSKAQIPEPNQPFKKRSEPYRMLAAACFLRRLLFFRGMFLPPLLLQAFFFYPNPKLLITTFSFFQLAFCAGRVWNSTDLGFAADH